MFVRCTTTIICLVLAASVPAVGTNPEISGFQGHWEVTELVENGQTIPREAIREWLPSGGRVHISDNAIVFRSPRDGQNHAYVFAVDGTRNPRGIEITTRTGQVSRGIYRFDDGRLVVCFADPVQGRTPVDFSAAAGSRQTLMVLRRVVVDPPPVAVQPPPTPPVAVNPPVVSPPAVRPPAVIPPGTTARVLTDAEVRRMLVGVWRFDDGMGPMVLNIFANGTFNATRDVEEIQVFQTVFMRTPVSSGTWNVLNGQLMYYSTTSIHPERVGRTMAFFVRSITARDLIFVDGLGRVWTAVKLR